MTAQSTTQEISKSGRPTIGVQATNFTLPPALVELLNATGNRSKAIRDVFDALSCAAKAIGLSDNGLSLLPVIEQIGTGSALVVSVDGLSPEELARLANRINDLEHEIDPRSPAYHFLSNLVKDLRVAAQARLDQI